MCWELDALSPVLLRGYVEDAILDAIDAEAWNQAAKVDEAERASMREFLGSWHERTA